MGNISHNSNLQELKELTVRDLKDILDYVKEDDLNARLVITLDEPSIGGRAFTSIIMLIWDSIGKHINLELNQKNLLQGINFLVTLQETLKNGEMDISVQDAMVLL